MKTNILLLIIFLILLNYIGQSYKLERLNENEEWELIEEDIFREEDEDNSDDNILYYKPIKVERRENLYMRVNRDYLGNTTTNLEPISVKIEIRSKDIQETFMLYGLNNDTAIKKMEPKDNKSLTTPIRVESCFNEEKPIYLSLSMFNYLWGGDLIFNIEENEIDKCESKNI
ncbi:hypothetical protein DICPUDRAFT_79094 [Dictyostelium purpureum]|uniref:Carbohydrate binding domain-containing protein n=1 Tax=Dictyostelium purpureum TaxID=5786 RepID=F0ZLJ4_DICPU|nr:uncharacterized protein DICPUDRAFT_79094 [Dictyostelium purpureum]EGC35202.1 hypothetical protein DICPUDRAFT_79094 [Dictyostelium purpureum]|eukprot:XP_003288290.1 hypothetical protein DICPUDRAFT_79094 [Dictyostelium purpureum]